MDAISEALQGQHQHEAGSIGKSADSTSILIHEVKSLPNDVSSCGDNHLQRKLISAQRHVDEARAFVPWVKKRDPGRAEKLSECGAWLLFRQYIERKETRLASGIFCQQPLLCGFCAAGRASRQSQAVQQRIDHVMAEHRLLRPYMVTLTMRSRKQLKPMVDRFWKAWGRMVRARRNSIVGKNSSVMGLMNGGVVSGEAKRGKGGGWHYHAHGIFLSDCVERYVPVWERLKREWARQVGQDHASVQFQPLKQTVGSTVREVIKYAAKWEPGNFADRWEAFRALHRVRRIRTFGNLYGLKLPEDVTDDLSDLEAEEYIERAFRYGEFGYREVAHAEREKAFDIWNEE